MMKRAAFAAAIRPFAPGGKLQARHIPPLDALADALDLPRSEPDAITPADFDRAAKRLQCEPAQIKAVWEVESGGGWFTDLRADLLALDGPGGFLDGPRLPKILFEAHIFDRQTNGRFRETHPNLSSQRWNRSLYVGGQGEYERLYRAMQLHEDAALKSASVGGAQIMGFNHKLAGYETVHAFWDAMRTSETAHLAAFCEFIQNTGLTGALQAVSGTSSDCAAFARGYNGPGYRANHYDEKIAAAYRRHSKGL